MKKLFLFALGCLFILNNAIVAQSGGKFDTTFGAKNGFAEVLAQSSDVGFPTKRSDVAADGKVITVADSYDEVLDDYLLRVTRFDANGKLDKTFGQNNTGEVLIEWDEFGCFLMAMAIQPDGKILASALVESGNSFSIKLVRLTVKGELDPTFGNGGFANVANNTMAVAALVIQPLTDGNILLAGVSGDPADQTFDAMVCKVNTKGALISSFGNSGFFMMTGVSPSSLPIEFITDLALTTNGSIVISGFFSSDDFGLSEGLLARLTPAGKLDLTFSTTGVKNIKGVIDDVLVNVVGVEVQKDGKLLALISTSTSDSYESELTRFNLNGATDLTFGTQGKVDVNYNADDLTFPIDLKILANNQIVTAVQGFNTASEVFYSAVNRYNMAGVLDNKFGDLGTSIVEIDSIEGYAGNLMVTANNNIIVMVEGEEVNSGDDNYYQYFYRLLNPDVVGVKEEAIVLENLKITPNPTFNTFTLSYNLEKNQQDVKIDLIDLEGRIVKNFAVNGIRQEGKNQELLDVSAVLSGIYFLRIQTPEQVEQIKVVKI